MDWYTLDNSPRFADAGGGHVESWFFRANDPDSPRAVWIKTTVLKRRDGSSVAEAWCSVFDAESGSFGAKATVPLSEARFESAPMRADLGVSRLRLEADSGQASGAVGEGDRVCRWDLTWRPPGEQPSPPLTMAPRRLVQGPIPKNKIVTPSPALLASGEVEAAGRTWNLSGWIAMQGHNWGPAHPPRYAWGHCNFLDADGEVHATLEGAAGRISIGGLLSPVLAVLVIRVRGREYRFDRLVDLWNRTTRLDFPAWELAMKGPAGRVELSMTARADRMVCLGYENPDGCLSYCLNSKLAAVELRMNPTNDDGFELRSEHGGALEILQPEPEPSIAEVV